MGEACKILNNARFIVYSGVAVDPLRLEPKAMLFHTYIENWTEKYWQVSKCLTLDMANRLQRLPEVIVIPICKTLKREEERKKGRNQRNKKKKTKKTN